MLLIKILSLVLIITNNSSAKSVNKSELCGTIEKQFRYYGYWFTKTRYLSHYLESIEKLECSQQKQRECKNRHWQFTPFTELLYDRFCDRQQLIDKCLPTLRGDTDGSTIRNKTWDGLVTNLETWDELVTNLENLDETQLRKPCIQAALYDGVRLKKGFSFGWFEEAKEFQIPFCKVAWCGVDKNHSKYLSPSLCVSSRCKVNQAVLMTFHGISSVVIALLNFIAVVILLNSPKLNNISAIYKTNIALTDLLSATLVLPSTIFVSYFYVFKSQGHVTPNEKVTEFFASTNQSVYDSSILQTVFSHQPARPIEQWVITLFGFLNLLCLYNTLYLLLTSSIDRFLAVCYPYKYGKLVTKRRSVYACLFVWFTSVMFALIPAIDHTRLSYVVNSSMFMMFSGQYSFTLASIQMGPALILLWIFTITTLMYLRNHKRKKKETLANQNDAYLNRAITTLALMAIAFTMSVAPYQSLATYASSHFTWDEWEYFDMKGFKTFMNVYYVFSIMLLYNSFWNFFIYHHRDSAFRKSLEKLFEKYFRRNDETRNKVSSIGPTNQTNV